jgi:alpha-galactosidase
MHPASTIPPRRLRLAAVLAAGMILGLAANVRAVSPTADEMASAKGFASEHLSSAQAANLPYSFVYGGRASSELLRSWTRQEQSEILDSSRTRRTVVYTDPQTGLEVRCIAVEYQDFPLVEWTLHFRNTAGADSPLLENVQALDVTWQREGEQEYALHHAAGSQANRSDYGPRETPLPPSSLATRTAACGSGPDRKRCGPSCCPEKRSVRR